MSYEHDWKPTSKENEEFKCRQCGSKDVYYRTWESFDGAYTDYHYRCGGCEREWWFEGADY